MHQDTLQKRFFAKIRPDPSGCIVWTGASRPEGYGLLKVNNKMVGATHVSWFIRYGEWPTQHVLHRCDNPPCVNPEHLFQGTDADNAADRDAKGRHCALKSFDVGTAKLTGLEVSEIVALTNTRMGNREIGRLFGVSESHVSMLRHGRHHQRRPPEKIKPYACTTITVGVEQLSIQELATRAGVTDAAIRSRLERGVVGEALLRGAHKTTRKQYTRKV